MLWEAFNQNKQKFFTHATVLDYMEQYNKTTAQIKRALSTHKSAGIKKSFSSNQNKKRDQMIDNIFDVYPTLSYLNGKLGRATRGGSVKRMLDGGVMIVEQLIYNQNSTVDSYSGAETLDTTLQDEFTVAKYDWKQYSATVGITGRERRQNNGEAAMIDLLSGKVKVAEMSLRDRMSLDVFGDGTGNNNKNMGGLDLLVSATSTAGLLAPATYTWWVSTVTSGGSFAAQGIDDMRTTFNTISFGNDKPDFIVTTQDVFEFYEKALQPQERFVDIKSADAGFQNLTFKGVPMHFDRDCNSGTMYFLNSNYLNLVVHSQADFSTGEFLTRVDQDVTSSKILWQGNMTTNNRRYLGKITGITA